MLLCTVCLSMQAPFIENPCYESIFVVNLYADYCSDIHIHMLLYMRENCRGVKVTVGKLLLTKQVALKVLVDLIAGL